MDILNRVMLVGNLVDDPEVRDTANGAKVANLCLAIDGAGGGEAKADDGGPGAAFVDVVLWDKNAENAAEYLGKGSQILLEGRLQQDAWTDRESGQTRRKLKIVAHRVRYLGGGSAEAAAERERRSGGRSDQDGGPGSPRQGNSHGHGQSRRAGAARPARATSG